MLRAKTMMEKINHIFLCRAGSAGILTVMGLALASLVAFPAAPAGAADLGNRSYAAENEIRHVTIGLNKSLIVELPRPARDVLVSNPKKVDAVVRSSRATFLIGKEVGQTNVFYFDAEGQRILTLEVRVERDMAPLHALFRRYIPGSAIRAEAVNDNIILTGRVNNTMQARRAQDMAARFIGDKEKVMNMLITEGKQQVLLKVTIAEMQRTLIKQLGINLSKAFSIGSKVVQLATVNPFPIAGQALSGTALGAGSVTGTLGPGQFDGTLAGGTWPSSPKNAIGGVLRALERNGLLRTLAEPNLTAISGETAKFLAGGEFPVPASRDQDGNVTIEFKPFGVGLSFTPVVMDEGRISLKVATEVSELTNDGAFTLSGTLTIPALKVRRANTTVEMPSGGSLVMAGLIKEDTKQALSGLPGAKDIPILGALFRSRDFQKSETELVVIITPFIVNPVARDKLARPDEGYVPANDAEAVLLGRLNAIYGMSGKRDEPVRYRGSFGFIVD